jgi:RNA polymerase sigma factor (sigma-70 family)
MRSVSTEVAARNPEFGTLLDQNQPFLHRLVVKYLSSWRETRRAEDVLQAANLLLCREQALFRGKTVKEFRRWARPFAEHATTNFLRVERRYKARFGGIVLVEDSVTDRDTLEASGPSIERILERREVESIVRDALKALPVRDGLLLRLFYFDDVPLEELAARAHRTEGAMRKLIARSLEELRRMLCRCGWGEGRQRKLAPIVLWDNSRSCQPLCRVRT